MTLDEATRPIGGVSHCGRRILTASRAVKMLLPPCSMSARVSVVLSVRVAGWPVAHAATNAAQRRTRRMRLGMGMARVTGGCAVLVR